MKNFLIATAFLISSLHLIAQESTVTPIDVKLVPNTIGSFTLSLSFTLDMGSNAINPAFWLPTANRPDVSLKYGDQISKCKLTTAPFLTPKGFGIVVSGFNQTTLERFLGKDKDNQITIVFNSDIKIQLATNAGQPAQFWIVEKDVANGMIADKLEFTEEDRSGFLTDLNNFFYYENRVDFGVQPAGDEVSNKYFLTLRFQNAYNRKGILDCNKRNFNPLYWNFDSRLSTDVNDSLNYIHFYPVNFLKERYSGALPYQLNARIGHESNQSFTNKRVAVDASFKLIVPNLINLTTAKANRIRLKPIVETGLKGYYDYSQNVSSFASGQAFAKAYYYIPVFTNYAIIFEGHSFYDFSNERNPDRKILGNYALTIGAEIPKTGFKAMFKFADGRTDINFKQGKIIALGLLMDFFQEKPGKASTSNL